jgi:energy-coupling factor transporter ATP-binding protein EcfA2
VKLLELEIWNVRGIPYLELRPNGETFVVWGPNGSGKSAVVDAVDFLLTGRISRLTGRGTGAITLAKHGAHVDHDAKDARVRAKIQVAGLAQPVEIVRCMARPGDLDCDEVARPYVQPIVSLAQRGQHVLTRRDILRYITAEPSTRAEEIQELLNIAEIEEVRRALVKMHNDFEGDVAQSTRGVETARGQVNATVQQKAYRPEIVLQVVNESRAVLGGKPIARARHAHLKTGVAAPKVLAPDRPLDVTLVERDIANLRTVVSETDEAAIGKADQELRASIATVRSDPTLARAYRRQRLTELGIELIDDTGSCPLCDTPWPPGELRRHLEERLSAGKVAADHLTRVTGASRQIADSADATIASVRTVSSAARLAGLQDAAAWLQGWMDRLQGLATALAAAVEKYPDPRFGRDQVRRMLAPATLGDDLDRLHRALSEKYPESTPEQIAWDTLTRLEENLKAVEEAEERLRNASSCHRRGGLLLESFQSGRDAVLGRLYNDIRDRFVELYRELHGADEDKFAAKIEPEGAALNIEVDFYGRGMHPPHALHSEGHQDSMGLCLYLALAERLSGGIIDLIILDDVMMSVDVEHRRELCRLLATSFPGRQFLITTHDKAWANQLRTDGVVTSKGTVEFYNWSVTTGPLVSYQIDMWERIAEDFDKGDVSTAAGRLRRGLEEFFASACDALEARVVFKLSGRWELADYLSGAMPRYKELLGMAKSAAQSWGQEEVLGELVEVDSTRGQIYARSGVEQWAVNVNVHYNNWANFGRKDFSPVVDAFRDLCHLFVCSKCGGMLRLASKDATPVGFGCACGAVHWNLTRKVSAAS